MSLMAMPVKKIGPAELADMVFMRAAGYGDDEMAEELGVSTRTVQRHRAEIRKRAEEVGPHMAVLEAVTRAGPAYGLFRLTPLGKTPDEVIKDLGKELK